LRNAGGSHEPSGSEIFYTPTATVLVVARQHESAGGFFLAFSGYFWLVFLIYWRHNNYLPEPILRGSINMNKLLFLDVDGVLNNAEMVRRAGRFALGCQQLSLLKMITAATCCKIVLSSNWRLDDEYLDTLRKAFDSHLVPHWTAQTPDLGFVRREDEIKTWLEGFLEPAIVVILDNDRTAYVTNPPERFNPCIFIPTDFEAGLTLAHAEAIMEFLKEDCR